MEKKIAHLGMIQAIISRMSINSFLLKGWSVGLVSALFALSAAQTKTEFVYLAYFPAISFWILDGYFLRHEKLFRALYDRVRNVGEAHIDFSMDTRGIADGVKPWAAVIFSKTLLIFHGTVILAIVIVMLAVSTCR
jgi:hypothetical protein